MITIPIILESGARARLVIEKFSGPSSYPSGGFEHVIPGIQNIVRDASGKPMVMVVANGGYMCDVVSVSGAKIKILVRGKTVNVTHAACGATGAAYASATTLATVNRDVGQEIDNGTDLSGVEFIVVAVGE